jgi:restriction system protein
MAKSSFVSTMNAIARKQAQQQRQAEAEKKRRERERVKWERDAERVKALKTKGDKEQYLEARNEETADKNDGLTECINDLQHLLEHTLSVNDTITFESLRIRNEYSPMPIPQELAIPKPAPDKQAFISKVKAPGFLENALGLKNRYLRELQAAQEQFGAAHKAYEALERERQARLADLQAQDDASRQAFNLKALQRNQEVDELEASYKSGDISAVITYNTMVLERSEYPDGFPQQFRIAYAPDSKEIVIEYELPNLSVIPIITEYKYSKTKDTIEEKPRKPVEIKELYLDIVAAVTIRTIHEVLEANQSNLIEVVTFNGLVQAVDPATGKDVHPCLVSVRTIREKFMEINLSRIDKRVCLRNLGAQVSPQPQALQPVKPVVEFDMVDKRFVEQADVLSDLESRPNLMELTPGEFEALVSNLFGKMGLETKLTRASRDGGVDAVAFDIRPILGGKVVIQAKRYKNTVGVSAVRDLYGTMLNEGATKGIIVATSSYGPDAYNFAKDKPLELIDGGGLLYLLDQVGIKARIVFPEEG